MKRRITTYITSLIICSSAHAQNDLQKQLNLLINDSTNRFQSFKTGFKYQAGNDSVFYSTFNLQGTSNNIVMISNDNSTYIMDSYIADISKSISNKQGRKLADEWKEKISAITGSGFRLKKMESKNNASEYGWYIEKGNFSISIVYQPSKKNIDSFLLLHISYLHLRNNL